jgi:hypothetical protein
VSREALLALSDAIARFERGELDLDELRLQVAAAARSEEDLRGLEASLDAIALGVCDREQRPAVLEQLEPVSRLLRGRLAA